MTWSYNENLSTDRDKVRFRIGDTDTDDQLLSNETIDALLVIRNDVVLASIDSVQAILAQFAREIDRQALGLGGPRSQKTTHYENLLKILRAEADKGATGVFYGGATIAEKDDALADTTKPRPPFRLDQFNNLED
tara:strand:- start:2087 stop:2491 length:405 start_codon:yes stop_codon:yes gene_type:complete